MDGKDRDEGNGIVGDSWFDQRLEGDDLRVALASAADAAADSTVVASPAASREASHHHTVVVPCPPSSRGSSPQRVASPPRHAGTEPLAGTAAVDAVADALAAAVYSGAWLERPYNPAKYAFDADSHRRSCTPPRTGGMSTVSMQGSKEGDLNDMLDSLEMQSALFQDHLRECARMIFERRARSGELHDERMWSTQ